MEGYRKLFVGIDFSPASDEALRQAHERATASHAALAVCHIVPTDLRSNLFFPQLTLAQSFGESLNMERIGDEAIKRITQVTGRHRNQFELIVDDGTPYATFLKHAENWAADLIMVGSHGESATPGVSLGNFANQIIRHAHSPVLVVRASKGSQRIVAGTDFSDSSLPAVSAAAIEAKRMGAKLTVVHSVELLWPQSLQATMAIHSAPAPMYQEAIKEMERASKEKLAAILKELAITAESRVTIGQAASILVEIATDLKADLLVVGTLGRTGLRRALLGSVAEAVATHAPCSVLIVRLVHS